MHEIKIDNKKLENVIVLNMGSEKIAALNYKYTNVYGRNGDIAVTENSYKGYTRVIKLLFKDKSKVDETLQNFFGFDKKIEFSDNENCHFFYDFNEEIEKEKEGADWISVSLKLKIHPFKYFNNSKQITLIKNGTITNIGNIFSEPKVTIYGNGKTTITIGTQVMEVDLKEKLIIECKHGKQNLIDKDGNLANSRLMRGAFFEIPPGLQGVNLGQGITKAEIEGRWRNR